MSAFLRSAARVLGLTVTTAGVLSAQDAQKACEVDEGRPNQVGRATLAVQVAAGAEPNNAVRQLSNAVKMLTENADRISNPVGRNLVLGKALVIWTTQPNVELVTKRGPLGYTTDPEGMIDLAAAIDTAFKVVEEAHPECIAETSRWRGQKGWVTLVNSAIERLNAEDYDGAEKAARQAIVLNPYGPYGYVVLANVMQKRNQPSEAFVLYRKSIEAAERDSAYNEIRYQSLIYLGNLAADSAEMAADSVARRPYYVMARDAFNALINDAGAEEFRENARSGMCRVAILAGDTASLRASYSAQLGNPAGYPYGELMNAGVCLARAEMVPPATTLFRAAYEKNAYHRDVLSNLAIMLLNADKHDEAVPFASRLVEVEPNNPENLQLLVLSYAGIAKSARDLRTAKPAAARPGARPAPRLSAAASDSLFQVEKRYTELAVSTNELKEKLPFRVSLSEFSTSAEKATIAGSVANQTDAAKPVTLKVEFLDKAGNVVAAKEADLGTVAAGASARFNLTTEPGSEVAAFRYTRLE